MKYVLEGQKVDDPEALEAAYDYRLVTNFGWSKPQIDQSPGHWTDRMLAIREEMRRG